MSVENGVLIGVGVAAVVVVGGIVTYKILKEKKPEAIDKAKTSIAGVKGMASELTKGAREAYLEGYASVKANRVAQPAAAKA